MTALCDPGSANQLAESKIILNFQSQVSHFPSPWDVGNAFPSGRVFLDLPFRRVFKGWYTGTQF